MFKVGGRGWGGRSEGWCLCNLKHGTGADVICGASAFWFRADGLLFIKDFEQMRSECADLCLMLGSEVVKGASASGLMMGTVAGRGASVSEDGGEAAAKCRLTKCSVSD